MSDARLAPFHAHGGRVEAARALFGGTDWIDLSTGIAPWAWPVGGYAALLERLPEPGELTALEAAAAGAFGADPANVVALPGSDLAMRLLAPVICAQRPAVLVPGYAGHRAAWPGAAGVSTIDPGSDHDLLVLSSPANPDGRVVAIEALRDLGARTTVVVDEAYADPSPGSCPDASDRLIVLRSFGKFYGLPGLRLGFVVAGPRVAAAMRTAIGDWPVSGMAIAIGRAAYGDRTWQAAQACRISETGALLDLVLADAGLDVVGTAPLFRLVACNRAAALFRQLADRAILTRPFADQPDRLRIGLPRDGAALARLAMALKDFTG